MSVTEKPSEVTPDRGRRALEAVEDRVPLPFSRRIHTRDLGHDMNHPLARLRGPSAEGTSLAFPGRGDLRFGGQGALEVVKGLR